MKRHHWLAILTLGLLLTACGRQASPPPAPEPEPPAAVEPQPAPEPPVPAGTNPLTGEPMEPELETLRPVAVMFNNLKAAQPQIGVSGADLIYEVVAEGGITRMLGVFQSLEGVEELGSIRSTRAYYLELTLGHDALLVHAGGSPEAYRQIPAWDVDNMDGVRGGSDAEIFWRDPERRKHNGFEHSLMTSGEQIQSYLEAGHFRRELREGFSQGLTFAQDGTPAGGAAAEEIAVKFSPYKTGIFTYDPTSGQYLVSQYGKPHTDGGNGQQLAVTNLLVLETDIHLTSGDAEGRQTVRLTGTGQGTFCCGGRAIPIQWSRGDRNSPLRYTLETGAALALGQGKTYICIIDPDSGSMERTPAAA